MERPRLIRLYRCCSEQDERVSPMIYDRDSIVVSARCRGAAFVSDEEGKMLESKLQLIGLCDSGSREPTITHHTYTHMYVYMFRHVTARPAEIEADEINERGARY